MILTQLTKSFFSEIPKVHQQRRPEGDLVNEIMSTIEEKRELE